MMNITASDGRPPWASDSRTRTVGGTPLTTAGLVSIAVTLATVGCTSPFPSEDGSEEAGAGAASGSPSRISCFGRSPPHR